MEEFQCACNNSEHGDDGCPNIVFVDGGICHPCLASHLRYGSLVLKGPNKSNHSKKSSKKGKHQRTNIPTTKINPQSIPTTPPS